MTQVVDKPTFTSGSLLDVVIVNDPDIVKKSGTRVCDASSHKYVIAALSIPRPRVKPTVVHCRPIKRVDVTGLHDSLHSADWQAVYCDCEGRCADQWERFLSIFMPILDRYAPMKRVTIRNPDAPHVTEATRDLMCRRREARRGGDSGSAEEYRSLNRAVSPPYAGTCVITWDSALSNRVRLLYTGMSAMLSETVRARELHRRSAQTRLMSILSESGRAWLAS